MNLTPDDRKSKLRFAAPLAGKKARYVKDAIVSLLSPVKEFVETITFDNGLLRQYFPKAIELVGITMKQVLDAVDKLNNRPRKCLNFKTPYETFESLTGVNVQKMMGYALIT